MKRKPDTPPPDCPDRSRAASAALAALRADPGPTTARGVVDVFAERCEQCGDWPHISEPVRLDWYAARAGYDAVGDALAAVMFPAPEAIK